MGVAVATRVTHLAHSYTDGSVDRMAKQDNFNPQPLVIDVAFLLKKLAEKQRLLVHVGGCLLPVKKIQLTRDAGGKIMAYVFQID